MISDDQQPYTTVDERWMTEWLEFGYLEMERYLKRHAQFDAYLRRRNPDQQ